MDYSLSQPGAMALVCQEVSGSTKKPAALADCDEETPGKQLVAFVANGPTGDVGILNLTTGDAVDTDPTIPEVTRAFIGGYPADVASRPDSKVVWVLDPMGPDIVTMDPQTYETTRFPLPYPGGRLFYDALRSQLLVAFAGEGSVGFVALGEDGQPAGVDVVEVGGSPNALVAVGDGTVLVTHMLEQHVTLLDLEAREVTGLIGIVPACRDGLDNDGDGLVDAGDPGCFAPRDMDEEDAAACPAGSDCDAGPYGWVLGRCGNGLDDDGDGLADLDDPGCSDRTDQTEESEAAACSDGLDNDGDGDTDFPDDADCGDELGFAEAPPESEGAVPAGCSNGVDDDGDGLVDFPEDPGCADAQAEEVSLWPCADGLDNDGDGLADHPADPDCFGAGGAGEKLAPLPMAEAAVSPDGRFAYVVHKGYGHVVVLDLEERRLVDVNAGDDETHHVLRRMRHEYALAFSYSPLLVVMREVDGVTEAYVADAGGQVTRVVVQDKDGPRHLVAEAESEDDTPAHCSASKPHLLVEGDEIALGYSPVTGYPDLGPLMVETLDEETNKKRFYGITFTDDLRSTTNETWRVEYEGALPGMSDALARVVTSTRVVFEHTNLCSHGVLPGDYLVLRPGVETRCGDFQAGEEYNYTIEQAGGDWVVLEAGSGWTEGEGGEVEGVPDPTPACFPWTVAFSMRPAGVFTVRGSRTGFLHQVIETEDGCEESQTANPLFNGRAAAATVTDGVVLEKCPITAAGEGIETATYSNPILSFDIFPACRISQDGLAELVAPERSTVWTFTVATGFALDAILAASTPVDWTLQEPAGKLLLLDLTGKSIKAVTLKDFTLSAAYY
jgi:hypothetical protein